MRFHILNKEERKVAGTINKMQEMVKTLNEHVTKKHQVIFDRVPRDSPNLAVWGTFCLTCQDWLGLVLVPAPMDEIIKKGLVEGMKAAQLPNMPPQKNTDNAYPGVG